MNDGLKPEPIRLTYADLADTPQDGRRYEILEGNLFMGPSPTSRHQRIVGRLFYLLTQFVQSRNLGEVFIAPLDVELEEFTIVEPDVIYVSNSNKSIVLESHIRGIPELVVEVLSASSKTRDLREKRNIYSKCHVPHYWIVDPDERALWEFVLVGDAYAQQSEVRGNDVFRPALFGDLELLFREVLD